MVTTSWRKLYQTFILSTLYFEKFFLLSSSRIKNLILKINYYDFSTQKNGGVVNPWQISLNIVTKLMLNPFPSNFFLF